MATRDEPYFRLDRSRAPLLVLRAAGDRAPTDADLDQLFAQARDLITRDEPYVLLYELGPMYVLDASQRRRYSRFIELNRPELERLNRGTALVIPNPLVRGIAKAVMWLAPPPTEVRICSSFESALAFCERWLLALERTRGAA